LIVGAVLAVFVAMAVVSLAFASGGTHHGKKVRVLHLTLQHTQDADVGAGDPGPSVSGVPVHIVAARLGDDPKTVLSTYAHLLPQSDEQAAERVAALLAG
jgi:hypothetical protein